MISAGQDMRVAKMGRTDSSTESAQKPTKEDNKPQPHPELTFDHSLIPDEDYNQLLELAKICETKPYVAKMVKCEFIQETINAYKRDKRKHRDEESVPTTETKGFSNLLSLGGFYYLPFCPCGPRDPAASSEKPISTATPGMRTSEPFDSIDAARAAVQATEKK